MAKHKQNYIDNNWRTCKICGAVRSILTIDEENYAYKNKNGWTCSYTCYSKLLKKYPSKYETRY